jgi:hypothetical protein
MWTYSCESVCNLRFAATPTYVFDIDLHCVSRIFVRRLLFCLCSDFVGKPPSQQTKIRRPFWLRWRQVVVVVVAPAHAVEDGV